MRRTIVAGNWKMNKTCAEAAAYVEELAPLVRDRTDVEVVLCPPYTALNAAAEALRRAGGEVALAAQDVFWKDKGAYTSQVSPAMLVELGCVYSVVGHSEARGRFGVPEPDFTPALLRQFGDTDESVNRKALAVLSAGITPIICVGETIDERRAGRTDAVVGGQVERALAGVSGEAFGTLVFAYEPVWAIGTGEVCESDEADRVCGLIRGVVGRLFGTTAAEAVRVQYGGSVKPDNAAELLAREHIDGALVGGASLQVADFSAIVHAAPR
jgi:triosephosphate isomerase